MLLRKDYKELTIPLVLILYIALSLAFHSSIGFSRAFNLGSNNNDKKNTIYIYS